MDAIGKVQALKDLDAMKASKAITAAQYRELRDALLADEGDTPKAKTSKASKAKAPTDPKGTVKVQTKVYQTKEGVTRYSVSMFRKGTPLPCPSLHTNATDKVSGEAFMESLREAYTKATADHRGDAKA